MKCQDIVKIFLTFGCYLKLILNSRFFTFSYISWYDNFRRNEEFKMKEETFDFYSKTSLKAYNLDPVMRYQLSMLDSLDVFTRRHCENVANLTCRICEYMNASNKFTVYCTICAYLHDIGKLFIPAKILQKERSFE